MGQSSVYGVWVAEREELKCHSFLAAAPQLAAHPLTRFYKEWRHSCMLTEWMDRTLRLGYSLQCHFLPLFLGIIEINLSYQDEIDSLSEMI